MGEELTAFRAKFNRSIRIESRPERLTSEVGAVALRDVLERVGIVDWITERIKDPRDPDLITHPLSELLRTPILLIAQGWQDQDDADLLRDDSAMRLAVSDRAGLSPLETRDRTGDEPLSRNPPVPDGLASQPTISRMLAMLASDDHRSVLRESLLEFASRRFRGERGGHRIRYLTIDIDSLPVEVEGQQPGSEYNGYYHARVYHPIVASCAETGDLLDVRLRAGNAHTAEGSLEFIDSLLDRVEETMCQVASVRIDAGFPEDKLLSSLERRRTHYVARIKNNSVLDRMAAPYLRRPVGRPPLEPRTWMYEMTYQAQSWSRERRVVLVVLERTGEQDDLFLHHFWILTSWTPDEMSPEDLLARYRQRGSAEGYMGELMSVLEPALSSSPRPKAFYRGKKPKRRYASGDSFAINEVLLIINVLAYNLLHAARVLMERATGDGWSLRRIRERVLRVPGRIIIHARQATIAIGQASAELWGRFIAAVDKFRPVST